MDYALSKVKEHTTSVKAMRGALKQAHENCSPSNELNILTRLINLQIKEGTNQNLLLRSGFNCF